MIFQIFLGSLERNTMGQMQWKPIISSLKFYLYKQSGGEGSKSLAMLKGSTTSFEVVLTHELEVVSHTDGRRGTKFPSFKRGRGEKFYPVLSGGGGVGGGPQPIL